MPWFLARIHDRIKRFLHDRLAGVLGIILDRLRLFDRVAVGDRLLRDARILAFDPKAERLAFEDIGIGWLDRFDAFLARTSPKKNAGSAAAAPRASTPFSRSAPWALTPFTTILKVSEAA